MGGCLSPDIPLPPLIFLHVLWVRRSGQLRILLVAFCRKELLFMGLPNWNDLRKTTWVRENNQEFRLPLGDPKGIYFDIKISSLRKEVTN